MIKLFAASDHHFYHRNIIKYANRPFDFDDENCVIDNAKVMIQKHNSVVTNVDYVLMVGDLSAGLRGRDEHYGSLLQLLRGKKILVRGNHDHQTDEFYLEAGFIDVVRDIHVGDTFVSHYPCYSSRYTSQHENLVIKQIKDKHIRTIIHGHIHNKDPNLWESDGITRINVCVDYTPNDFYPVLIDNPDILKYCIDKYK